MPHYNTTSAAGRELRDLEAKADSQAVRIHAFFETAPNWLYTPSEIRRLVFSDSVPLTSVRRAMTDLTTDGLLVKARQMRPGPYQRPEHCWFLKRSPARQGELQL